MDITQWQQQLERLLENSPELRKSLVVLEEAEEQHEQDVLAKLHGYQAIDNCFQGFAASTLSAVEDWLRGHAQSSPPRNYAQLVLRMVASFQTFRAADRAFLRGYPLPGFALLRNVKDWMLMIGAIGNELTTLTAVTGLEQPREKDTSPPPDMEAARKRRIKVERQVLATMLRGSESNLDASVRELLHVWEMLFNMEIHGALGFAAFKGVSWMMGDRASPLLHPCLSDLPMLTFTNRANVSVGA